MRSYAAVLLAAAGLLAACSAQPPASEGGEEEEGGTAEPPRVKQPPAPTNGTGTAPNCDGIPESGECTPDGIKKTCDVANNTLRQVNCKVLQQECVMDPNKGATCAAIPEGGGGVGGDNPGPVCPGGVTYFGACSGADKGTAVWCDPATMVPQVVVCADYGMKCMENKCETGAYCCDDTPCGQLGTRGACTPEGKITWCEAGEIKEFSCNTGTTCQVDKCADGAFCCGS